MALQRYRTGDTEFETCTYCLDQQIIVRTVVVGYLERTVFRIIEAAGANVVK